MVDPVTMSRWAYRGLFFAFVVFFLFLRLLPLSTEPTSWPGPDLTLALILVWVLRRPDHVPALLIVLVVLLEDLLFMRPPGLWALIVLFATEFLRNHESTTRGLPFLTEWAMIAVLCSMMVLANRLALSVTMVPQPPLGFTLLQAVTTIVAYPVLVGLTLVSFGLRPASAGDLDALAKRS